ncbi:MAG: winged helix-turn-helix transcriptional regulator [Chloroflexi bacterium]|nr:winged helix-turn-helix transcriptional regulator [Chloroflexota bacterium]
MFWKGITIMLGDANIVAVASLLADSTRAGIILALSDGRAFPAGELARRIRVAPSTASAHLSKLVEAKLITVEKQGRHRYFRLTDPAIMQVIESLAVLAPAAPVHSLRESEVGGAVRSARMCYNHLAGKLGVALAQAMVDKGIFVSSDDGYLVTDCGREWFDEFGLDGIVLKKREPLFVPHHIDWSERRHHVAGALGAALARRLFDLGWIKRIPSSRAVRLTEEGQEELLKEFGLSL